METEPPQDLRRLVHSTANRMLEESLRNLRQHNEVRRLVARGDLTDLELNAAYHDYERQAGAFYRQAVADLTVRYHASLAELGVDYSRRFYDEILTKYSDGVEGRPVGAGPVGLLLPPPGDRTPRRRPARRPLTASGPNEWPWSCTPPAVRWPAGPSRWRTAGMSRRRCRSRFHDGQPPTAA